MIYKTGIVIIGILLSILPSCQPKIKTSGVTINPLAELGGNITFIKTTEEDSILYFFNNDPDKKYKQSRLDYHVKEQASEYVGGIQELAYFLKRNLNYPQKSHKEGVVYLHFIIQKDGCVNDVRVLKGLDPEFDKEAIRVIKLMPKWKPGRLYGRTVSVRYTFPVRFSSQLNRK